MSLQKLVAEFEILLPDFAEMVKKSKEKAVIFHQDSFAADYQEEEYRLLGMAINYMGLHGRDVHIVGAK